MIELLMASMLTELPSVGKQVYKTCNQIGQIVQANGYGHCTTPDGKAFYTMFGWASRTGPIIRKLFKYTIATGVWESLGGYPRKCR